MDREHGAREACEFVKKLDFEPSGVAFDAAFADSGRRSERRGSRRRGGTKSRSSAEWI